MLTEDSVTFPRHKIPEFNTLVGENNEVEFVEYILDWWLSAKHDNAKD
jgi:hypothetical protein